MPAVTPVTMPVPEPTVATPVLALLHPPPVVASLNVVVCPAHTLSVPVIVAGRGLTVTVTKALQPDAAVQVMVAVPADTPVTMPLDEPMIAMVVAPLLHVPDGVDVSVVVPPAQTVALPEMAGVVFTVTVIVL